MRKLIFRGTRPGGKGLVFGNVCLFNDCTLIISQDIDSNDIEFNSFEVIRDSVQQFTGFYDKHKKPIYDSDVLIEEIPDNGKITKSYLPVFYHKEYKFFCIDTSYSKDRSSFDEMHELDFSQLELGGY